MKIGSRFEKKQSPFKRVTDSAWKHKKPIAYACLFLVWLVLLVVSGRYGLGQLYFVISGMAFICLTLGKRDKRTLSAYSIFNKGAKRIEGDGINMGFYNNSNQEGAYTTYYEPEKRENRFVRGRKKPEEYFEIRKSIIEKKNFSKFANQNCYCGSEHKYKKCCMENDIRVSKLSRNERNSHIAETVMEQED